MSSRGVVAPFALACAESPASRVPRRICRAKLDRSDRWLAALQGYPRRYLHPQALRRPCQLAHEPLPGLHRAPQSA